MTTNMLEELRKELPIDPLQMKAFLVSKLHLLKTVSADEVFHSEDDNPFLTSKKILLMFRKVYLLHFNLRLIRRHHS